MEGLGVAMLDLYKEYGIDKYGTLAIMASMAILDIHDPEFLEKVVALMPDKID